MASESIETKEKWAVLFADDYFWMGEAADRVEAKKLARKAHPPLPMRARAWVSRIGQVPSGREPDVHVAFDMFDRAGFLLTLDELGILPSRVESGQEPVDTVQ